MRTKDYRTPQEIVLNRNNPRGTEFLIGLDIGYGGVKMFLENGWVCFPSYAKKLNGEMTQPDAKDIIYRDETGVYLVGYNAQNMTGAGDTNDTDELFSRNRYFDPMFKILYRTAIGIAIERKMKDRREIFVQSSLPASYLEADADLLQKVFTEKASFSVKRAGGAWVDISLELSHIAEPLPQPMAALYSAITLPDGHMARNETIDAERILTGGTLVIDGGFETLDLYGIQSRRTVCVASVNDLGMYTVFDEARKMILSDTGEDIRVAGIQKYLTAGAFFVTDRNTMSRKEVRIAPYLEKANAIVLERAKEKIKSITNVFDGYDSVIIAGGTGAAWFQELREWLANMKIAIYASDCSDGLGMHLSVARGDYMCARNIA